ncbi:MAG: arginine--tRNA ligase, partial [Candidatus Aenigmatarchaeota archaeon]
MVSAQNPSEEIRKQVVEMLFRATGIDPLQIDKLLEKPPEGIGADFAFPCFVLAKKEGRHPAQIAKEVAGKLKEGGMIKEIKVRDAYVNFYANWEELAQKVVQMVLASKGKYGAGEKKLEKVLVEHTSANPDGPLHLGHFRNTVLGDSLARIYKFYGYPVKTDFYFNTTGRQIGIAAMEYRSLNGKLPEYKGPFSKKPDWEVLEFYKRGNRALETDKSLEKDIQDIMQKFESGDQELRKLYSEIVEKTLEGHKQTLEKMGVKVDSFKDEAKFLFGGEVHSILNEISKRVDIGKIDGKRIWVDLKRFGIDREFTLTRSDGTTLYPARDLAYHADKFSRADININVIGTDQKFYFQQLRSTLSMLYPDKAKHYTVVFYEFLLLPEGTMSTRLGRFVSVDELIERSVALAMETVEKKMPGYSKKDKEAIANAVGIGALKYAMI